jgi:glycosidase
VSLGRRLFALGVSAVIASACGSDDVHNRDFGQPPDASAYDPGKNPGGDGYGSGSNLGGPGFVCPDDFKTCPQEFTYPDGGENTVELRGDFGGPDTWQAGAPMTRSGGRWRVTVSVPFGKAVQYKFLLNGNDWEFDPAQPTIKAGNDTNNVFAGTTCAAPKCEEPGAPPPGVYDWRDAVIYFAFVDRFNDGGVAKCNVSDGNGPLPAIVNFQGGDWPGVTAKINDGYFTDLGVNTLWLTVPVANAMVPGAGVNENPTHNYSSYHGYWPKPDSSTPSAIAAQSCFGTLEQLKALVDAAHAKNIRILFDYAMVGVHQTSQVYADHHDWFWENRSPEDGNKNCVCGQGCSWDNLPDRERCWFADYLPHWNYTNQDARNYSVQSAVEWAKQLGIDGFRLDAIKHVDISWLTQLRTELTNQITKAQTPSQRFYLVGETFTFDDRDTIKGYVDPNTKLDGQFDFPLRANIANSVLLRTAPMGTLASFMDSNDYYYGGKAIMSTFIGNHDLPRVIHLAADNPLWGNDQGAGGKDRAWSNQPTIPNERSAFERLANAFGVILTNRGAPLIYYGDEIGMPGAGDPDNRRMMTFTGLNANQTWLKDRISKLLAIRAAHPSLRRGVRTTMRVDGDVWVYSRATPGDATVVAINRSDDAKTIDGLPSGATELVTGTAVSGTSASVPARTTLIFATK